MNEEEKLAIEILKERKKYLLGLSNSSFYSCDRKLYKERVEAIDTILKLIDKQQTEIENRLEEIKNLYMFISIRDERIDELAEINEKYNDLYISKDKLKDIIKKHKKFLVNEFSNYPEDDIENRKAIQYALARLSFLLTDILKED